MKMQGLEKLKFGIVVIKKELIFGKEKWKEGFNLMNNYIVIIIIMG